MKTAVQSVLTHEKGKVLILVLVLLGVGALLLAPLLGLMSTGLTAGQVYEKKAAELYAADAGVEDGIWKLQHPDVSQLPHKQCADKTWSHNYTMSEVNGKTVNVTIDYLGEGVFRITATGTTLVDGSSTTILTYLTADYLEYDIKVEDGGTYYGTITAQTVYAEGDLYVTESIEDGAVVFVEGDLTVDANIEGDAYVYVKGDLELTGFGNIEDTAIVCVEGNLTLGHCSENGVEVYVGGNLTAINIENESKVCVEGNAAVDKIENGPTVCVGEELAVNSTQGGYIYAPDFTNLSLSPPDCPMCCDDCDICCECPLEFGKTDREVTDVEWSGWRVTTYIINPESD